MAISYAIEFVETGEVEEYGLSYGYRYEFPDGSTLDMRPTIAWCASCQMFVDAEWLQPEEEIQRELVALKQTPDDEDDKPPNAPLDLLAFFQKSDKLHREVLAMTEKRLAWRRQRKSPPKCVLCGSTNIRLQTASHEMTIDGRGQARLSETSFRVHEFREWVFTPEGDRIHPFYNA